MAGCGLVNDAFKPQAGRMLAALAAAQRANLPTAMLGQGIGPLADTELRAQAAQVLPNVGFIFLRERRTSRALLQKLSVPENRIFITGDDAVEPAFNLAAPRGGHGLGINLRLAAYAGLDPALIPVIHEIISAKARQQCVPLIGLPIYTGSKNSDVQTITPLAGAEHSGADLATPLAVMRRTAACRIVVTGSYHAAVFALAQGIPVVGIVQSRYYAEKFHGLAGEFDGGCIVLAADEPAFAARLTAAVASAWTQADEWKPRLRLAAERQIKAGHAAYARLPELLSPHPPHPK
jgi:colanic acid/amylovoran biosynthesis protein